MTTEFDSLKPLFEGDIDMGDIVLAEHSRDASLFEIRPKVVLYPRHSKDVQTVVKWVNDHRAENQNLSVTPRSAGTDMSGGPLGQSIVMDFTRYMNAIR